SLPAGFGRDHLQPVGAAIPSPVGAPRTYGAWIGSGRMADFINKFFELIFVKIPSFIAQTVFAMLTFLFRPYRSVIRLSLYSRRNKIPTILYLSFAFALFMLVGDLATPGGGISIMSSFKSIVGLPANSDEKLNVFYALVYLIGLTALAVWCQICIEAIFLGY